MKKTRGLENFYSTSRVVNGPLKNEKSQQILLKSRNLAQPTNGSQSLRFCVCQSQKNCMLFYQVTKLFCFGLRF